VAVGSFGWCSPVSVLREIGQELAIIRCARKSEKGQEGKEGLGLTYAADFGVEMPAGVLSSDEQFLRLGGVSCRWAKGRWRRSAKGLYSCG
jgi:hypothetical protein